MLTFSMRPPGARCDRRPTLRARERNADACAVASTQTDRHRAAVTVDDLRCRWHDGSKGHSDARADEPVASRRRLEIAGIGVADDHRAYVFHVGEVVEPHVLREFGAPGALREAG